MTLSELLEELAADEGLSDEERGKARRGIADLCMLDRVPLRKSDADAQGRRDE